MSWRDEWAKRLDDMCGLNPTALGIVDGVVPQVDRAQWTFWRNPAAEQPNPLDGTRLWDNS